MKLFIFIGLLAAVQGQLISPDLMDAFMKAYTNYKIGDDYVSPFKDLSQYVTFNLYTRKNRLISQEIALGNAKSLRDSNFDSKKPTYVVIHGYLSNLTAPAIQGPKNALLGELDYNVFAVDWGKIAITNIYSEAVVEVPRVGAHVAEFLKFVRKSGGLNLKNTHIVGHSLGAHISGFTGKNLKGLGLARITGLDPALPGFYEAGPTERIDASDADYVDCIHTCSNMVGFEDPICDSDYYPNGGKNQPGCPFDNTGTCSHMRAVYYYVESVTSLFKATQCKEIPNDKGTGCTSSNALMGYPATPSMKGLFYVKTRSKSPFAMK